MLALTDRSQLFGSVSLLEVVFARWSGSMCVCLRTSSTPDVLHNGELVILSQWKKVRWSLGNEEQKHIS